MEVLEDKWNLSPPIPSNTLYNFIIFLLFVCFLPLLLEDNFTKEGTFGWLHSEITVPGTQKVDYELSEWPTG